MLTALIMLHDLDAGLALASSCADHRLVIAHDGPSAALHDPPLPGPKRRGKRRRGTPQAPEQRPPGPRRQQHSRLALIDLGDDPARAMAAVARAYDLQRLQLIGCQSDHDPAPTAQQLHHHCGPDNDHRRVIGAPSTVLHQALAACDLGPPLATRAAPIGDRPSLTIDCSAAAATTAHHHLLPSTNAYQHAQNIGADAAATLIAGHPTTIAASTAVPPTGQARERILRALATAALRALHQGRPDHLRLCASRPSDRAALLRALLRAHRQPTWRASGHSDNGILWGHLHHSDTPVLIMPSPSSC